VTEPKKLDVVWKFDTALEGSFNEVRDVPPDETPPQFRDERSSDTNQ